MRLSTTAGRSNGICRRLATTFILSSMCLFCDASFLFLQGERNDVASNNQFSNQGSAELLLHPITPIKLHTSTRVPSLLWSTTTPDKNRNDNDHDHDHEQKKQTMMTSKKLSEISLTNLLQEFSKDLKQLTYLRPPLPAADFSAPTAIISAGSSYTRLWTHGTWERHGGVLPHQRYFKHIKTWPLSTSARKLLPAVGLSTLYSFIVSWCLHHTTVGSYRVGTALAQGSPAALAALSAPLALLLTLRANASLGRLQEARQAWGKLILRGRHIAALIRVYVFPIDPEQAILAARYLTVMGWSIKALVRNEGGGDSSKILVPQEREVYRCMLGEEETTWLLSKEKAGALPTPIAIAWRLRHIIASVSMTNESPHFFVPHASMDKAIDDLDTVTGICQRLLTSPIPPTYSRHLSRIMVMYLMLIPFVLVATGTPSLGAAAASAVISYVIIGVDEIGMEIENPFPLLPLQQLCATLQSIVGDEMLLEAPVDEAQTYLHHGSGHLK